MGKQELMDRARDELFSHIHRCGVLQASEDDQGSWMTETIEYLAERYPDLGEGDLGNLRTVGLRFCQPVLSRLRPSGEEAATDETDDVTVEATEEVVASDAEVTGLTSVTDEVTVVDATVVDATVVDAAVVDASVVNATVDEAESALAGAAE